MTRRQRILQNELCEQLIVEKEGPSGWITFNDPDRHNAISYAMWDGIPLALTTFQDDPEIKSVVLTGAGEKAFVSGANISRSTPCARAATPSNNTRSSPNAPSSRCAISPSRCGTHQWLLHRGGLNIALCCDLRIASDGSSFAIPAGKLGLGYRFSAIQNLVRAAGTANALEIFLTADRFPARQAREKGLLHAVTTRDELDTCVAAYLDKINALAPLTLQAGKKMINTLADRCEEIDLDEMKALVIPVL